MWHHRPCLSPYIKGVVMRKNTHQTINTVYVPLQHFAFRVGYYSELVYHVVQMFYSP